MSVDEKKVSLIIPSRLKEIYIRLYVKDKSHLAPASKAFTAYTVKYPFGSLIEYLGFKENRSTPNKRLNLTN